MKRSILIALIAFSGTLQAQQLPNANFDSLCICAIDRIWHWVTPVVYGDWQQDTIPPLEPNRLYSSDNTEMFIAHGLVEINYFDPDLTHYTSIRLHTDTSRVYSDGSPVMGFVSNGTTIGTDSLGFIDFSTGGTPFTFRPVSLRGFYRLTDSLSPVDEFGRAMVLLKKWNAAAGKIDTIGFGESGTIMGPTTVWKEFDMPIQYQSPEDPDSVVVVFWAATHGEGPVTLYLDSLTFQYSANGLREEIGVPVTVSPNPAESELQLDLPAGEYRYIIFGIDGRRLAEGNTSGRINVQNLPSGGYFLQVTDARGKAYRARWVKR